MRKNRLVIVVWICLLLSCFLSGCQGNVQSNKLNGISDTDYCFIDYPLIRNGIKLHLTQIKAAGSNPGKSILLIHGVTYSSHEFDINYGDYSLARFLAGEGYSTWLLDIAGFGRSEKVQDGFLPDTDYAAEDINAAVERISLETGKDKIDLLGWSWGTVTVSRFVTAHPEHVNKVVLYAPILCGIGKDAVTEPFHHNTWEHAADDFQRTEDGSFDETVTDPAIIEYWCSSCWHYDGESSPNGGRRDLCIGSSEKLIDLSQIRNPVLVICGDQDPYLNYDLINNCLSELTEGSSLEVIEGGSHMVFVEKPYYHDFRDRVLRFLDQ